MSWTAILALAAMSYAFKLAGLTVLDHVRVPPSFTLATALIPPALLSALVVVQTFGDGTSLVIDARAAGLVVGCLAVWRRAPFLVVVVLAAGTTALIRAVA
jgi:branched-subunit amino acid transport protein